MATGTIAAVVVPAALVALAQSNAWVSRMTAGNQLRLSKDFSAAEAEYRAALELARTFGENNKWYAYTLNNLAGLYQDRGSYREAEPMLLHAVALLENTGHPPHRELALSKNNLGNLYALMGRTADAETAYRTAIKISDRVGETAEDQLAIGLEALGSLYVELGRSEAAEACFRRAFPVAQRALGTNHRTTVRAALHLGDLHYAKGRYLHAERTWREALSAIDNSAVLQDQNLDIASILRMNLGELKRFERRYVESESLLRRAIAVFERTGSGPHPHLPTALNHLALTFAEQGKTAEAEGLYARALAILESSPEMALRQRRQHVVVLSNLARLRTQQSADVGAVALLHRALASAEIGYGAAHPFFKRILHEYSDSLRRIGRKSEASDMKRRASHIPGEAPPVIVDLRDLRRAEIHLSEK